MILQRRITNSKPEARNPKQLPMTEIPSGSTVVDRLWVRGSEGM